MPTVLFIHSAGPQGPGEGSSGLLAELRRSLGPEIRVDAPLMPEPDAPQAALWLPAIREALERQSEPFALVGHSLGGSSFLQHVVGHGLPPHLLGLVLVAVPFWGLSNWDASEFALPEDAGSVLAAVPRVTLLLGTADDTVPRSHLERYQQLFPAAETQLLPGVDHEAKGAATAVAEAARAILAG